MILLSNEVIVFLFAEALLWLMLAIAFFQAIGILLHWDFGSVSSRQYRLEKRAYLVVLIIVFTLIFKIALLPFFSYTVDELSALVPGAMCGAGVITANPYGPVLMVLKVAILFVSGLWLILNHEDIRAKDYPYLKAKFWLLLLLFALVSAESVVDLLYLFGISTEEPVACCSTIYGIAGGGDPLPLSLDITRLMILFYLIFLLTLAAAYYRYEAVVLLANGFFFYVAYYAVVYFFGTYVYELPTHQCPFCMLQKEYYYVGYLIWGTLFAGTFFGMAGPVLRVITGREADFTYRYSAFFNTLFVSLCSMYVIIYYLKNGVLL